MEDAYQLELPLMPANVDELYIDQAMVSNNFGNRGVFAAYTPYGVKRIDSDFCTRIQDIQNGPDEAVERIQRDFGRELEEVSRGYYYCKEARLAGIQNRAAEKLAHVGEDPEKLREEILVNPHLHACIKENLIGNLDRVLEDLKKCPQ